MFTFGLLGKNKIGISEQKRSGKMSQEAATEFVEIFIVKCFPARNFKFY